MTKSVERELDTKIKDLLANLVWKCFSISHNNTFNEHDVFSQISITTIKLKQVLAENGYILRAKIEGKDPQEPLSYEDVVKINKDRLDNMTDREIMLLMDVIGLIITPESDLEHYQRMFSNKLNGLIK